MIKTVSKCRICNGNELLSVMTVGNQALTGVFPKSPEEKVTIGPVELVQCSSVDGCGLVQLKQSYDLSEMYGMNYGYRSGLNSSMVKHLQAKVKKILASGVLQPGDIVIDIGSNDATTLRSYPENQYKLVGIDPAARVPTPVIPVYEPEILADGTVPVDRLPAFCEDVNTVAAFAAAASKAAFTALAVAAAVVLVLETESAN